ncbi:glutamate racemase [Microvirga massiliensis]|uniref:glutamate racemase n=1 Tax=Microvirga massiliensis TaxID=1033741 RepID=UPI00062B5CEC|nr:glutamate racemase [Microvirga massiliensis]
MRIDLLAGTIYRAAVMPAPAPTILVFDSGFGGLTVFSEAVKARPDAQFVYAADDAGFPYGRLSEDALISRVVSVIARLIDLVSPDLVVVACNTASTLCLPALRARFSIPFVGTVPAIKPAAALSRSKLISVLATPGTVARDYTRDLIATYGGDCSVTLVGSRRLAGFAEAELAGCPVPDGDIAAEIAPCFVSRDGARTDVVALACTHYPLLLERFTRIAPWPVTFLDPAPAVARRMTQLLGPPIPRQRADEQAAWAVFTGGAGLSDSLRWALAERGLPRITIEPMPLHQS